MKRVPRRGSKHGVVPNDSVGAAKAVLYESIAHFSVDESSKAYSRHAGLVGARRQPLAVARGGLHAYATGGRHCGKCSPRVAMEAPWVRTFVHWPSDSPS